MSFSCVKKSVECNGCMQCITENENPENCDNCNEEVFADTHIIDKDDNIFCGVECKEEHHSRPHKSNPFIIAPTT